MARRPTVRKVFGPESTTGPYLKSLACICLLYTSSLAGIDQMNILQAQTASPGSDAGAGAGAGISVPSVGDIGEGMKVSDDVQKTIDKFRGILEGVKKAAQPTIDALGRLKKAFDPFAANVGKGLKWAWDNVLAPMGKWVLSKAVPTFLDLLSGAFKTLNGLLDAFKPIGKWLWEKFLQPIASWTGGVIVSVLGGVAEKLSAVGDWIGNHGEETTAIIAGIGGAFATWKIANLLKDIKGLCGKEGFGALGTAIKIVADDHFPKLAGAFDKITGTIKGFGSKIGKGIQTFLSSKFGLIAIAVGALITVIVLCVQHWDEIKQVAIDVWNGIVGAWNAAGAWFDENVIQPIFGFFKNLWSDITGGASQVWEGIKSVFSSVGAWFHDVFSDAWAGIVSVFSKGGEIFNGIKEGISNAFKGAVNGILRGINTVVSTPLNFLNGILNKIRNLSFLNISPFKGLWKENPIYVPQIPLLANGCLAYGPTLAMIGEGRDNEALLPLNNQEMCIRDRADCLSYSDAESCQKSLDAVSKAFGDAVSKGINDRLRQAPPKTGGTGTSVTKEQFAQMGYAERVSLKRNDPEQFQKLSNYKGV